MNMWNKLVKLFTLSVAVLFSVTVLADNITVNNKSRLYLWVWEGNLYSDVKQMIPPAQQVLISVDNSFYSGTNYSFGISTSNSCNDDSSCIFFGFGVDGVSGNLHLSSDPCAINPKFCVAVNSSNTSITISQ